MNHSRRGDLLVGATFAALFLGYLFTATFDQDQNIDALSTLVPAWQLASHGNVYADQYAGFTPWFVPHGDHIISNRLPGAILWATPFYVVLGRGGDAAPVYPAAVASAAAAALAVFFTYVVVRRLAGRPAGLAAALVLGLATPTWGVSADALWTHGPAQAALAASLVFLSVERYAAAGLVQAAAVLVRPHLAVVPLCTGLAAAYRRRSVTPLVVVGLTSALGVLGLLTYFRLVYGQWTVSGGYGQLGGYGVDPGLSSVSERLDGSTRFWRNVAVAVWSPGRGLLVYSPFLVLLLPGLRSAWSAAPSWVRSAAVSGLVYAVVQLWNNGYSGEDFFGYRFLLEPLVLWTPLLTLAYLRWTGRRPRVALAFWLLVAWSFAWQATAAVSSMSVAGRQDVWRSTGYEHVWAQRPAVVAVLLVTSLAAATVGWARARSSHAGVNQAGAASTPADPTGRPIASSARPTDARRHPAATHDHDP